MRHSICAVPKKATQSCSCFALSPNPPLRVLSQVLAHFFPRVWPMSHFFSSSLADVASSVADIALWLGSYMSTSSKNVLCTKTQKVRKCRQITTNQNHTNQPDDPQIPSQICVPSTKNKPDTQKGQEPKQKHPQKRFAIRHSGLTTASHSKTCQK